MDKKILSVIITLSLFASVLLFPDAIIFAAGTSKSTVALPTITYGITYEGHIQRIGWQNPVIVTSDQSNINNVSEAGTVGKSLKMEALKLTGINLPTGATITYQAHVQGIGWQSPVTITGNKDIKSVTQIGTVGKSLRMEAIKITLNGMPGYCIQYKVQGQHYGWQEPITVTNGTNINAAKQAGSIGQSLRMEAIKIQLVKTSTETITTIDATKYNLDITGKKDTSVAFQKMVDSSPKGCTLNLPKGTYKFDSTVKLDDDISLVAQKDVVIIGTGNNTLFSAGNLDTFDGINFENCSTAINVFNKKSVNVLNSSFRNNITFAAINYYGGNSSIVKFCTFYDIRKYGVLIDNDSYDITIDNNNFNNSTKYGGYTTAQIGGHVYCLNGARITVSNNVLNNSGGQGVIFGYNKTTGKGTTDSIAINNFCQGNGQEGATIYGGSSKVTNNNSIISNNCTDNRFNQIEVWQADNCIVKDNTVSEPVSGTGSLGAISLFSTTKTTCTGNKVLSAQSNGIDITAGSLNCIISNNNISDTNKRKDINTPEKGNAILLDSNGITQPEYITITNNTISSTSSVINKSGIYSTSNTNHHNTISANTITGYHYGINPYAAMTCDK